MRAGDVGGGNQQEENERRLAVEGLEIHPAAVGSEGGDEPCHGIGFAVGNGDAVANPGTHDFFALDYRLQHFFAVGDRIARFEAVDQFLDDFFFAVALETHNRGLGRQNFQQGHSRLDSR